MGVKYIEKVWKLARYKAEKLLVLLALADWADEQGICYPSYKAIAAKARVSKQGAISIVAEFVNDQAVEVIQQGGGGRGHRNIYRLRPENWKNGKGQPALPFTEVKKGQPERTKRVNQNGEKGQPERNACKEYNRHENHHKEPSHTHAPHDARGSVAEFRPRVCVDDRPHLPEAGQGETTRMDDSAGSRFARETCIEYAHYLHDTNQGIKNPVAYGKKIYKTGEDDGRIQIWLDKGKLLTTPDKPAEVNQDGRKFKSASERNAETREHTERLLRRGLRR